MCRFITILYRLVALKAFRAFLVRRHMEACPRCSAEPSEGMAAGGWADAVRPPDWIRAEACLWPEIERRLREAAAAGPAKASTVPSVPVPRRPAVRLVPAAAALAAVAVLGVLAWRVGHRLPGAGPAAAVSPRVEVLSAEVEGRKARPSIFQTKNASYIWFSRTPDEGGRK